MGLNQATAAVQPTPVVDVSDDGARQLGIVASIGAVVTARDFWLQEIRAGRAFMLGVDRGPTGGFLTHVQLYNPAASGKTVLVHRVHAVAGADYYLNVRRYDTALGTDEGAGVNLLAGGAAGAAHVRTSQDSAAQLGTLISQRIVLARVQIEPFPEWSWELGEGEGLVLVPNAVNNELSATFFWVEG